MEEYDLKDLFNMFWKRKFKIFIIILLFLIAGAIYSYTIKKPLYTSYTTLLLTPVTNTTSPNEYTSTETALNSNARLVATYRELVKSNIIIREVIKQLDVENISESTLKNDLSVTGIGDSDMIKISATTTNTKDSSKIANITAEVFCNKVPEIYKINNLHIIDKAEESTVPSNINHSKDLVISLILGCVVTFGYVLFAETFKPVNENYNVK